MFRRPKAAAPLWAAVAAGTAIAAQAQPAFECAALRPSRSQQPGYAKLPGQPRCEGFFEQNVAQPFIELVSLTRGQPRLESATRATLQAPAAVATRLLVQPLRAAPLFRMDAELRAGQAIDWDPMPMLSATGLRPDDLGFLATAAAGGETLRVAALALAPEQARSSAGVITLRPSVALSWLAWRSYASGQAGAPAWQVHAGPAPYAWQPLSLPLELPAGELRVDVRARDKQGQDLPMFSFVVLGSAP